MTKQKVGTYWRHYKGNKYFVLTEGKQTDNTSEQIIYAALKQDNAVNRLLLRTLLTAIHNLIKPDVWVRSQHEFIGVAKQDNATVPRFRRIN